MYVNCPACSNLLTVGPEHLGQVVECPHCHKTIQIPAAANSDPKPEPTKKCPHCGETILKVARRCKFCKVDIPEGYDEDSAAQRLRAKEGLVARQADPHRDLPRAVTAWFQTVTIVLGSLTLLSAVAGAIGVSAGERSDLFFLAPLGIVLGIILAVFTLIFGLRDLFAFKYYGRQTAEKGAKAFWGGLCASRYQFAYYCMLDADKDVTPRMRPALVTFGVVAEPCSFEQLGGFRDYWKNLIHKGGTQAVVSKIRLVRTQGDLAEVTADLKLTKQSTSGFLALGVLGALLFATRDTLSVRKLFRRVDGQWYAVNGEFDSGEDCFGFDIAAPRDQ